MKTYCTGQDCELANHEINSLIKRKNDWNNSNESIISFPGGFPARDREIEF